MMNEKPAGADWRSILLLIFSLGGALVAFTSVLATLMFVFFNRDELDGLGTSLLSTVLAAASLAAVGFLLLPAGYYSLGRLRGRLFPPYQFRPLPLWIWGALSFLWVLVVALASLYYDAPGALLYIPVLHCLAIGLPVFLLVRAALNRISPGSQLRVWGVWGSGMSLSLAVAATLEIAVLAFFLFGLVIYLVMNPEQASAMRHLVERIQNAPDLERMVYTLAPLIKHPLTLVASLFFLSGVVPLIEEFSKSLGVLLVVDRLSSPAQGFALGALSGAGFALVESLYASMNPGDTWAITLSGRALSGLMHILASGLTGMGVAYARLEKRYFFLAGLFGLAALIHAAWNAGAVLAAIGALRVAVSAPHMDFPGVLLGAVGLASIFLMAITMLIGLAALNRRWRASTGDAAPSEKTQVS